VNAANPTFVLDQSNVSLTTATPVPTFDVRLPISSSCFANPFNQDGAVCQGGAIGTPFFLVTNGSPTAKLFGDAYQTDAPVTGTSSGVTSSGATVSGAVNPLGGPVQVEFQFGTTTGYGQTTTPQTIGPTNSSTPFAATITGQPASTPIHYRALAITDFGTVAGGDQTFTTAANPPPPPGGNDEPHSRIKSPHGSIKSKKFKSIKGTASDSDGVKRVEVAVVGFTRGVHVAAKKRGTCLLLRSNGKLKRTKADKRNRCTKRIFLKAKGTTSWTFKLKKKLPKGSYVIFSRAIDKTGKLETHFSSSRGNRVTIKVK
jgi:hypothetical protein